MIAAAGSVPKLVGRIPLVALWVLLSIDRCGFPSFSFAKFKTDGREAVFCVCSAHVVVTCEEYWNE